MSVRRVVAGVTAALILAGCSQGTTHQAGSSSRTVKVPPLSSWVTTPVPGAASEFHNPVDLLRKTTCTIPPDVKIGKPTVFGDGGLGYFAECYWGKQWEDVDLTVWRYPSHAVLLQALTVNPPTRSDGVTLIKCNGIGPDCDWIAEVMSWGITNTGPSPAVVARQLGGTIS
jgi:hypothetical protein